MKKSFLIQLAISLALLAALLYFADVGEVIRIISRSNVALLAVSFFFYFCINVAMAYRIKRILGYFKIKLAFSKILLSHFAGMLASDFTPARSGYFTTAFVLSANNKIPLERAMVSILGPQLFDFLLKVVAGGIAIWYLFTFKFAGDSNMVAGVVLGLLALFGMIILILLLLFSQRFAKLLSFLNGLPYGAKVHKLITDMQENSHAIKALVPFLISILAVTWSFKALEWWFVGMSLGFHISVPFPEVVFYAFFQPVVTLLQFIPTPTLAGIGVAEAGAALVLMQFGITLPEAVAYTLLTRFVMIVTDSLGIGEGVKALKIG